MNILIKSTPNNVIIYLRTECGKNIKAHVLHYLEEVGSVIQNFGPNLPLFFENYNKIENYEE